MPKKKSKAAKSKSRPAVKSKVAKKGLAARGKKKAAPKTARKTRPTKKSPAKRAVVKDSSWFDEATNKPVIDQYAQKLGTFIEAMADGQVDAAELGAQEARLVAAMRDVEPLLKPAVHEKVTRLLWELTAYDLMQVLHSLHAEQPATTFHG